MSPDRDTSEDKWKQKLSDEQYHVMRENGTEKAGTGKLLHKKDDGTYVCAACGAELFDSDTKFESGSGWPSFYDVKNSDNIELKQDDSMLMNRVEVVCKQCGSHLGHVFDDGPEPTGKRYCINSVALEFEERDKS